MKKTSYKISDLSPHLFWDVEIGSLSWDKDDAFIMQRVLEYGLDKDWQILKVMYGVTNIGKIACQLRDLDNIALHFISSITNIPLDKFRCYTLKQSIPHYSGY